MKDNWTYRDLIDLEYCLSLDKVLQQADLHERDRQIYLDSPEDVQSGGRDALIHHWLQTRTEQIFGAPPAKSPGRVIVESYRSLSYLLSILGVILGFAAGISFLAYSGTTPVNVLNFLFLFIFSQVLIVAIIFPVVGLRMAGVSTIPAPIASLYGLISSWFSRQFARLDARIPADRRMAYNQIAGLWKQQQSRYRQSAYWPLFSLSQYTMASFNTGLLAATLYRLITSDIAFGWQSTIQFSTPFIDKIVRTLALPWSWIVPSGYAYPSEAEIEGSRIILKDGIYHLATQDLVSWWPFLVLCIVVYGLLLRFILIMIGRIGRKRSLRNIQPNTPVHIQLVQRLQSPLMTSQAAQVSGINGAHTQPVSRTAAGTADHAACSTTLLIPAEMDAQYDAQTIRDHLERCGFHIADHRIFMAGYDADRSLIDELASQNWPTDAGIAAVMEAWMPPINETLIFMRDLRSAVGPSVPIWVVLAGQFESSGMPAIPAEADRIVWQRKIDELADPYVNLISV